MQPQHATSRVRCAGELTVHEADAVIFAVGITGMQKLVQGCGALSRHQDFRNVMNLKALDVLATRLWFDKIVKTR